MFVLRPIERAHGPCEWVAASASGKALGTLVFEEMGTVILGVVAGMSSRAASKAKRT